MSLYLGVRREEVIRKIFGASQVLERMEVILTLIGMAR